MSSLQQHFFETPFPRETLILESSSKAPNCEAQHLSHRERMPTLRVTKEIRCKRIQRYCHSRRVWNIVASDTKALRRRERCGSSLRLTPSSSRLPQQMSVLNVIQFHHEVVHSYSPYLLSSPSRPGRLPHTRNDIQFSPPSPGLELDSGALAQ